MKLIHDIGQDWQELRFTESALRALHEAIETYLVALFEDSNLAAIHAKRIALMQKDMQLVIYNKNNPRPAWTDGAGLMV